MNPITDSTRAASVIGRLRLETATANAQPDSISSHSSSEPSCEPHVAANLYCTGSVEYECCATLSTEKSLVTKLYARQPNATATSTNCSVAAGRATAISAASRRHAPHIGTTVCTTATISATISAKLPSSAIIARLPRSSSACPRALP